MAAGSGLDLGAAYGTFLSTVFGLGLFVIYSARRKSFHSLIHPDASYLSARNEISWGALSLSLYASFMGNWVLFLPPITGAMYGWPGVLGYTLSISVPYFLLAWLSPLVHDATKTGFCSCDHLASRFGVVAQLCSASVSLCSMFVALSSELTTVGMSMAALSGNGIPLACSIIVVTAVPLIYVLVGGLKCCIISDVLQALVIVFLFLPFVIYLICTGAPLTTTEKGLSVFPLKDSLIAGSVLVLSVWPVFLSDQGIWQRVWAARSVTDIRIAFVVAGVLAGLSVALFGVAGTVCLTLEEVMQGASLFTYAAAKLSKPWLVLLCVLAVACVTSSVDTYQAGLVSVIGRDLERFKLSFNWARVAMVLLNIPAVVLALYQVPLMSLFMVSNFLCAVLSGPFLLSVHPKLTNAGFLGGLACALLGLLLCGIIASAANQTRFSFSFFSPEDISTIPHLVSFGITPIIGAAAAAAISAIERSACRSSTSTPPMPMAKQDEVVSSAITPIVMVGKPAEQHDALKTTAT